MGTVTLLGSTLAEPGEEFVYRGESSDCEGCPYRNQCLNLTPGRRYQVTTIREGASTLDCDVHHSGVRAVEVEPVAIQANVPSDSALVGNKARLAGPCPHSSCPSHEFCIPDGVSLDEEYRIAAVLDEPPHDTCQLDRDLTLVEFEAPEES